MANNSSNFRNFTRGGQIILHAIRMFWQVFQYGLMIAALAFAGVFYWVFDKKTTDYDIYILQEYLDTKMKVFLHGDKIKIKVKQPTGQLTTLSAGQFIYSPVTDFYLKNCKNAYYTGLIYAGLAASGVFALCLLYFWWEGKARNTTNNVSGNVQIKPKQLRQLLKKNKEASNFTLAGVPLVKDSEVQHILMAGATGSGKSVAMKELMDQVRDQGQRAIVYDIDEAFVPLYYRKDKDIILNPLDVRTPAWNVWQECQDMADYDTIAVSLMPEHLSNSDPFWIRSAQTIFASAALQLQKQGKTQTKLLLSPMFDDALQSLSDLVAGTPAASLASDKIEKTALSIKATLSTYCKALMYLKEEGDEPLFSIRRWIESDKGDSWLFISTNAQKIDALKPLLSVWLDVAAKATLSLKESRDRRLWFFLDELPSLHKLPSLKNALSRGRKYGACFVGTIQDHHQPHAIYGRDEGRSLMSLFSTKLLYRTQDPDSAAWMSKITGEIETLENKEGFSYGAHEMRDGVSINQERRKEPVVKASDFLELEDLNAYLRLPGNWPITKLTFNIKDRSQIAEPFIARDLSHLMLDKEPDINEVKETLREAVNETELNMEEKPTAVINPERCETSEAEEQDEHGIIDSDSESVTITERL